MPAADLDPTDVRSDLWRFALVSLAFAAVGALAALDLAADLEEGTTTRHALIEGAIVLFAAGGIALGLRRVVALRRSEREARAEARELSARLADTRAEAERWRGEAQEHLSGLGRMIERQLVRWGLTQAEREVALLMLKGLSHKEIARLRAVSAATVRQQAAALYRKAGVEGRHDLSAFFLEDLLAPREGDAGKGGPGPGR
ncbi:MAG: helix-turn-helix transcriptional regulator [Planctomycetes bacterium]|nr:helix-turn-helix transcriptional regulator [Planctomycetota bacterium]